VNTLQEVYAKLGNYKEAYDLALVYHSLTDSLFKAEVAENLARMKTEYSLFESEKTKEIQALKIKRQHVIITTAVFLVLLLIILVWQVIRNSIMQKKAMILLQKEQQRSEELLQSILPEEIISEMKERGKSQPRLFYDAAVLNIDIVGFTEIADKSSPDSLFEKINEVFTICDDICIRNNCQRIKTSGDSYLAVSGMFHRDSDYKEKLFVTAVEIMQEMKRHFPDLKFRAGISCGRIIGAVVGKKNFIYDIFGSTVNTAFRMQEAAEPGTICIDGGMEKVLGDIYQFGESYEITIKGKSYLTWKVQVDRINS
jgi:class 3 adenylate cyclase